MASNEDTHSSPTLTENERMKIIILANNPSATLEGLKELVNDLSFGRCSDEMSMKSPWNPTLRLEDGELAKDKALALMNRRGTQVSPHGAIHRIMLENTKAFQLPLPEHWNAETFPGGIKAIERAIYLVEREDFSASAAMECIMFEFPGTFFEEVPPQWTNAHTDAQNAALKIGKNWIKHDGIDAMSCIKSIMSEPELREAFDPDESSVVNGPRVAEKLPYGKGHVVVDMGGVDNGTTVHDQLPMSQNDAMNQNDDSLTAYFSYMSISKKSLPTVASVPSGRSYPSFKQSFQKKQQVGDMLNQGAESTGDSSSFARFLDTASFMSNIDPNMMPTEDLKEQKTSIVDQMSLEDISSWMKREEEGRYFNQNNQTEHKVDGTKTDAESADGLTSFSRVLTYAMSNTDPSGMPTEEQKNSILVTPTKNDQMPLEDHKARMETQEQSHIFNQGIQTEQEVEGTKSDAENNSEPRDTHDENSVARRQGMNVPLKVKEIFVIETKSRVMLAVCKTKADAGRHMFGKSDNPKKDNPGKRVSYALNNDEGCLYDRKQGQKTKDQFLFRVCVVCQTGFSLDIGPSGLGRQKLPFDKDGNPW